METNHSWSEDFQRKLFIGTTSHACKRYCAKEFSDAVKEHAPLSYKAIVFNSPGRILFGGEDKAFNSVRWMDYAIEERNKLDSIHRRIVGSAEMLRKHFLSLPAYEWYLSLESDVILNKHTLPALAANVAKYPCKIFHTECYTNFHPQYDSNPAYVDRITMGCTLIHRTVLEKIVFRYEPDLLAAHYDAIFAGDAKAAGYDMLYDASIVLEHRENRLPGRGWENLPRSERG